MTRAQDPFDELAAMFLTAPTACGQRSAVSDHSMRGATDACVPNAPHARPHAPIELLLVGHLPVRAGLWLTPYVDAVAREHGCTAMLRLDGDEPTLQVLRGSPQVAARHHAASLDQALMELGDLVDHWVVRASSAHTTKEILAAGVDCVTILSSGDEAAVVAAYQIIRDLAQQADQAGATVPLVGLVVVGSDLATASEIVDRLNRTTVSFLGVEVRLAMCLARMDAGVKSTSYMSFPGQTCPALAQAVAQIQRAKSIVGEPHVKSAVVGRIHPERPAAHVSRAEDILCEQLPAPASNGRKPAMDVQGSNGAPSALERLATQAPPRVPQANDGPTQAPAVEPRAASPIKLRPKPVADVEAKQMQQPHEPSEQGQPVELARHVAGLMPLPVRMPGHEHVELAVDSAGGMHLLCRETGLRELSIVEHWARAHCEILALACPQHAIDGAAPIISHVFTDQPVTLTDLHGANLRLHVLAPVKVGGQTAWYTAPLNVVR